MDEEQLAPMEAPGEPEESAAPAASEPAKQTFETPPHRRVRPARPGRPALTITIQSWATPIVGLVMLAAGLLLGYFGRPYLEVAAGGASAGGSSGQTAQNPSSSSDPAGAANQDLMEFLVGQTRHFKGNPDAPVTVIEFSDFQ